MHNYQLHNTNILLGGQQKWDIVLESDGKLYVKDFHISPVSSNVPYNDVVEETLLNYSHQENLKKYYKKVMGNFYRICPDSEFSNMWPSTQDKKYSDTYIAGVKRTKIFNTYKKQFEFLCPIWLEYLDQPIKFIFEVVGNNGVVIGSKSMVLSPMGKPYHDKFVKYFRDYIKYVGLDRDTPQNDYSINLLTKKANIYGLDVSTGVMKRCNCDYVVTNLLSRERPMMENDFMLCNVYKMNNLISHHLFNFNFIFNIDDILSHIVEDSLIGNNIIINIKTVIGDETLPVKSFYTNYENIGRYVIGEGKPANIFSYLNDYKYIHQIDKNKFDQQICHWSIDGNNEYIFNLYKGFGSMYYDHNKRKYINNRYFNSPDLSRAQYMKHFNNLNWCNFDTEFDMDDMNDFELEISDWFEKSSNFNSNWVNNVKYNLDDNPEDLYVYLGICTGDDLLRMRLYNTLNIDKHISCRFINKKLLIISDDINLLTYRGFRNALRTISFDEVKKLCSNQELLDTYSAIYRLKTKIEKHIIFPRNIKLTSTLTQTLADGPSPMVREVDYIKSDGVKVMQRYDGILKPTFIDLNDNTFFNFVYTKRDVDDSELYLLNNYNGYPAIYPSLNYYYIDRNRANSFLPNQVEYKCACKSTVLVIEDNIHKIIDKPNNIDQAIRDIISKANKTTNNIDYLMSLYKYKYNELENGKYDINIELK